MQCQCGSQSGEYKQGISKKNNRPWKGWKCSQCGNMQFLKTDSQSPVMAQGGGNGGNVSYGSEVPVSAILKLLNSMDAKLNKILGKDEFGADSETPF